MKRGKLLIYKYYSNNDNFEDFSCGRVLYNKAGIPNYPVKITGEIFKRCLEYLDKKEDITVYDPCCGGGYLLTVLGLLNPDIIGKIIGSDISQEVIVVAKDNLSLLTVDGILRRKNQINDMVINFDKQSHKDAFKSTEVFLDIAEHRAINPKIICFNADVLNKESFEKLNFKADIIITDVPYGNLVAWSDVDEKNNTIDRLLDNIIPILHKDTIIAISTDKSQKIRNEHFIRHNKFKIGKRVIYILQVKGEMTI